MIQTAEDKVKEYCQCIRREIEHWKVINQNGCSDPFWPGWVQHESDTEPHHLLSVKDP